ncbi:Hypothetical predicted protein, partial [Marmota monax]
CQIRTLPVVQIFEETRVVCSLVDETLRRGVLCEIVEYVKVSGHLTNYKSKRLDY